MSDFYICGIKLDDIHKVQLELLDEVDRICKTNGIKYFLSGGTMLGAIRHKGFIPWDDDIDLWMTRRNFKKFKKVCKKDLDDNYFLQDYYTEINNPLCILKVEKKGTRYVEGVFADIPMEKCVYIDIFPLDNIWNPLYELQTAVLIKLQAIRDFKLRGVGKDSKIKRMMYSLVSLKFCRFLTEFTIRFFNIFPTKYKNQLCHRGRYWPKFTKSDVEDLIDTEFEGKMYPIPRNYDKLLTDCYGDYMKLPPEEKQQPTHDIMECKI